MLNDSGGKLGTDQIVGVLLYTFRRRYDTGLVGVRPLGRDFRAEARTPTGASTAKRFVRSRKLIPKTHSDHYTADHRATFARHQARCVGPRNVGPATASRRKWFVYSTSSGDPPEASPVARYSTVSRPCSQAHEGVKPPILMIKARREPVRPPQPD